MNVKVKPELHPVFLLLSCCRNT